jgi:hypothetical protein
MLKVIYNETTRRSKSINFDIPIPRIGETLAFTDKILRVIDVHYGINAELGVCFVEIKVVDHS